MIGETVVVTCKYSKLNGRTGTITKILNCHESPWMRTDRWMSDWFILVLDGEEEGFLEDQLERQKVTTE